MSYDWDKIDKLFRVMQAASGYPNHKHLFEAASQELEKMDPRKHLHTEPHPNTQSKEEMEKAEKDAEELDKKASEADKKEEKDPFAKVSKDPGKDKPSPQQPPGTQPGAQGHPQSPLSESRSQTQGGSRPGVPPIPEDDNHTKRRV